jgi:hypothetical protein
MSRSDHDPFAPHEPSQGEDGAVQKPAPRPTKRRKNRPAPDLNEALKRLEALKPATE